MNITTYRLPAYWASALINGDYSGLTDAEEIQVNEFLASIEPDVLGPCLDCSDEPFFTAIHSAPWHHLTECLEYSFPIPEAAA